MSDELIGNAVINATDDSFDAQVLRASQPVLVDFWAPWCGPCKAVAPLLEEIAAARPDIRVVKVNVDENTETAQKFNVRAIPTLLLFKNGEVADTKIGAASKPDLLQFIGETAKTP
ncbi:MAG: thioredoxin [Betaproteobacteria bacterium]|nr:thioredoxin [Betaproteobacteria bacterium]